ncbi:MAG: hypothetical protein P8144_11555 [Gammaproteobacteria bacterium]
MNTITDFHHKLNHQQTHCHANPPSNTSSNITDSPMDESTTITPASETNAEHPLANTLTIDHSALFANAQTNARPTDETETETNPLSDEPVFRAQDADPDKPGTQIDVVVSPGISDVDFQEIVKTLRQDLAARERAGLPLVEYRVFSASGTPGSNIYSGNPDGTNTNFLDFTAIKDSQPDIPGVQIDVLIDPKMSKADQQNVIAALQQWCNALSEHSGQPFEFYIWSDKSDLREPGEHIEFTYLNDNNDNFYNGRAYWNTPDQGRRIAFEPGSPTSIVMHEIGHALPLPAHTEGVMKDVNPSSEISSETIQRALRIYELTPA